MRALSVRAAVVLGAAAAIVPASAEAAFPGRDGRIAFERSGKGDSSHVYTIHPNGKGLSRVPCSTPNRACADGDPAWSRDGRFLAVRNADGVAILTSKGKLVRQVIRDDLSDPEMEVTYGAPAWSPGGRFLVMEEQPPMDTADVVVMRTDGSGVRRVDSSAVDPVWSIRNRIATIGFGLFTFPPRGKGRELTRRELIGVDWSPGGRRLVLTDGEGRLLLIGANGRGLRALTRKDKVQRQDPVWSPSGGRVVYVRFSKGRSALLVRNLRTRRTRTLVRNALVPDWQALRRR